MKKYPVLKKLIIECPCGTTQIINEEDTEAFNKLSEDRFNIISLVCGCVMVTEYKRFDYIDDDTNKESLESSYMFSGYTDREKALNNSESGRIVLQQAVINCSCGESFSLKLKHLNDFGIVRGDCQCGLGLEIIITNADSLGDDFNEEDFEDEFEDNIDDEDLDNLVDFNALKAEYEENESNIDTLNRNKMILSIKTLGKCEIKPFKKKKYHK